ncbi:hypothetical protein J132_06840 [Termitomyces sp. J132]|nr:hypothetical protein H2248_004013 [Termitomyces sp. 'cryptogamus']KNZ74463.1 hypothetical protein J132_06840 [Termitomyces sp. J132]
MFRNHSGQITAAVVGKDADKKKVMPPTLRSDIYAVIDQAKAWISGTRGQPGAGVSHGTILTAIQEYFPELTLGLEAVGHVESEVAVIVGGITNMIIEYSMGESMSGGMAMRTWVDGLIGAYEKASSGQKKDVLTLNNSSHKPCHERELDDQRFYH